MPRYIQPQIRPAFIEKAVRANWFLMKMVALFAVAVELFNMARVLFMTSARLSTLNNRIYFSFYASLFAAALLFLAVDLLLGRRLGQVARYRVCLATGSAFVLWHVLFAVYDINRSISIGKISAVTSLVAFAALFIMEPLYAVLNLTLGYGIMLGFLSTLGDPNAVLNYAIVALLSVIIYFVRLHDIRTELEQAAELAQANRDLEHTRERLRQEQKNRIRQLEQELTMDAFTRTLNRTALENYGQRRLGELEPGAQLVMLILDMDDFKAINDTYGHQAGDHVLARLGELMNELAPPRCRVGRLGGDEFAAILDPPGAADAAAGYAARLIDAVRRIDWEGRPMPAACSIGIAAAAGGAAYDSLYAAADKALYEAKRQGKGRCCFAP